MTDPNANLAATVNQTIIDLGVRHFVLCAGARNVGLIADLLDRTDDHHTIWHHFDERSACFFGLGLAKAKLEPVAILTTSGTAVAELLPAVIEAWYSGIPLVLVTADRPAHFRGSGAPQAIEQAGIFDGYVGQFLDLEFKDIYDEVIHWDKQSPLHLNVCLGEPGEQKGLCGNIRSLPIHIASKEWPQSTESMGELDRPIALVGELPDQYRNLVEQYLARTNLPAWLEATSGLRESATLADQRIHTHQQIVDIAPTEVIRIGGVPSLRFWRDLETTESTRVINFSRLPFSGLGRVQNVAARPIDTLASITTTKMYSIQPNDVYYTVNNQKEIKAVNRLSQLIPGPAAVFLGNSLPIREWNEAASLEHPHAHCFASRGANGIDGQVSTFLGLAQNYEESWGLFGDLTAMYDLNATWPLDQLTESDRLTRVVILNNQGGRIFDQLPAAQQLDHSGRRILGNWHRRSFSTIAKLWNFDYYLWSGQDHDSPWDFDQSAQNVLIEIAIDPET